MQYCCNSRAFHRLSNKILPQLKHIHMLWLAISLAHCTHCIHQTIYILRENQTIIKHFRNKISPNLFLPIHFIGLKWSLGIPRKSQKVSAFNFPPKDIKKGVPHCLGPEEAPPPFVGLIHNCFNIILNVLRVEILEQYCTSSNYCAIYCSILSYYYQHLLWIEE